MMEKEEVCPKCLGVKEVFSLENDNMEKCNFCFGEGTVEASRADMYDPIDTQDYMIEEDE